MEILNNIWIALSTPNEQLTNILVIFMGIFENILMMELFLSILNLTVTKKQKLLYVVIFSSICIFSIYVIPNPYNFFINYTINIILIYYIFRLSILKSILATVSSATIFGLIGFLLANPYLTILHISSEQLTTIPIYRLAYLVMMYIILYLIVLIIRYRRLTLNLIEDLTPKTRFVAFINIIFGLIALIIHSIILFYYIDILPLFLTFLSFISLLAYFAISIFSLTRIMKLTLTTRKLESAKAYNHSLRVLHDNVRAFKHDFDNIVTTIGGYIRTEDMEGLKKYYVQLEDDCQRVNNLYILNPETINNDGIYNLLTKKYNEADSKNIKVNITFLLDLENLHMKIYEFARVLGILFDNALEASSECKEKIINLTFRNDTKNSRELLIIENTYNDKNIDTEKIFEKGVSSKENHTGIGLWEVRKIIKKNNNVNLHTSKNNKFFSQQLEIYY